jgi:hypothetical protein
MQIRLFNERDNDDWDRFCDAGIQASFLHTRKFLSYHGSRFEDQSVILMDGEKWLGVMPAALHPDDKRCVVTHPGATYGGMIHQGGLRGDMMIEALRLTCDYYQRLGASRLLYKAVPTFYHVRPAQDDLYALYRLGAVRYRCDLSSTIDLDNRAQVPERRKRSLKKAQKNNVQVFADVNFLPEFWAVLAENLQRKHGVKPVHSLEEMSLLISRFPNHIKIVSAVHDGRLVAGVLLFMTESCCHAQYISSSETGYQISALDIVFEYCIAEAARLGKRWFDFGISTEDSGSVLNESLYRFKTEFGGGGTVHEFFEIIF